MTFVLKDFKELTQEFQSTVRVILAREQKKDISELDEPRKSEIQFLSSVITELEAQISASKVHNTKPYAMILYGAMLTITQDVSNHLNALQQTKSSLLWSSLMETMFKNGPTSKQVEPDANQVRDMHAAFHGFLEVLYVNGNSRKGLNPKHPFVSIPAARLKELLELSFKLDQQASDRTISHLKVEGKTVADLSKYTIDLTKTVPQEAVRQFKTWVDLKSSLDSLIEQEKSGKNVSHVSKLGLPRSAQLLFLIELKNSLEKAGITNPERVAVLAGAMYIVRGQISQEYKNHPLAHVDIVKSKIHCGLTDILDAKNACVENIETLINTTRRFLQYCTIERASEEVKRDSFRIEHVLSNTGCNLVDIFKLIQLMTNTCRVGALATCLNQQNPEATPASKGGFFSKLMFAPAAAKKEEVLETETQAATTTSGVKN